MAQSGFEPGSVQSKSEFCPSLHILKVSSFMKGSWTQVVPKGILGNRKSFGFKRRKKNHLYKAMHISHAHNNKKLETTQRPQWGVAKQRVGPQSTRKGCADVPAGHHQVKKPLGQGTQT